MADFIDYVVKDQTAWITLTRSEVHNALNDDFMNQLDERFKQASESDDVRAVVLAAEGKSYCAGADIHWMKRMVDYSIEENIADATVLADMLRRIRDCPKPTIARVHGAAFGAGVGLIAACDMSVAVQGAIFCLSEVRLGIVPAIISPFVLEKIGMSAGRRYALTAERFDARAAYHIGLVSDVVETSDELDPWITAVVAQIRQNGPNAIAECKRIMSEIQPFQWEQAQKLTTQRLARVRVSAEGQEGLRAFLEKRKPSWAVD